MRERRFTPLRGKQTQGPSRLADLDGRRHAGSKVHLSTTKAPKPRFTVGNRFVYDGSIWEIIYMYRMANEPGVWYHCLEEQKEELSAHVAIVGALITKAGAGATTPRIVWDAFQRDTDVHSFFSDIYRNGSSTTKSTQDLLSMTQVKSKH